MNQAPFLEALSDASLRCLTVLLHFLWQGAVVGLSVYLLLALQRRASASQRYTTALIGLVFMALCPIGTWWTCADKVQQRARNISPAKLGETPSSQVPEQERPIRTDTIQVTQNPPRPMATPTGIGAEEHAVSRDWRQWAPWAIGAYALVVLILLARLTLGLHGGRRLCAFAHAVTDPELLESFDKQVRALGLRATPIVATCGRLAVPTVVGVFRPTILLPVTLATGLTLAELETILAHELAHVYRHDPLVNLFQRLVEAFLFFHPAVWWLSRRIRLEREQCCDDLVVSLGAKPLSYAAALLRVAELAQEASGPEPALVGLYAVREPSTLRRRIARLLGAPNEPAMRLRHSWPLVTALAAAALPMILILWSSSMTSRASIEATADAPAFGESTGSLKIGILPVAANTDEQKPSVAGTASGRNFAHSLDLALLVELKNVGDKPVSVQGTRYGDVGPPWQGKSDSDRFAPLLFDCEFQDKDGKPLDLTDRQLVEAVRADWTGLAETIEPGKSLVCLIRPTHWDDALAWRLQPGDYRVRARYHGPSPAAIVEIKKQRPGKALGNVWTGNAVSAWVNFAITDSPDNKPPKLVWGPPVNGLQAALALRAAARSEQSRRDTAAAIFPYGSILNVNALVKNVSDKAISFYSETCRQEDDTVVVDGQGQETPFSHCYSTGYQIYERWTVKPGQAAVLPSSALAVAARFLDLDQSDHPHGFIARNPGQFRIRQTLKLQNWPRTGPDGKPLSGKDVWQGTLTTGNAEIGVRARRAEDEPPGFVGQLLFVAPDGKPITSGHVEVRRQAGQRVLAEGDLAQDAFKILRCPFEPLTVLVRAPGYEERQFYDVVVVPTNPTSLTLTRAIPLCFRLETADGMPVTGAKVRFFNRSSLDAASGPYPPSGLTGPVWATSKLAGEVVLNTLQKIDPDDAKLGNNIYWFYVEPDGLAPLFVGPVQAGQDLGPITVGPLLVAQGEVRGTPEELAAFAAEWDQPEPMKRGNGEIAWYYAESKKLETRRVGDHLVFRITGLHPGTLRIVSRFEGGKPTSHTYSRRDPTADDVVFETPLKESRSDLILTNKKPDGKKPLE